MRSGEHFYNESIVDHSPELILAPSQAPRYQGRYQSLLQEIRNEESINGASMTVLARHSLTCDQKVF